MSDSLANYYYYINKAESMLAENNLTGAKNRYEKARETKKNWFGKDLYNYSLVCLKLEDYKKVSIELKALKGKGFNVNLLMKKETFRVFFESKKGKKIFSELNKITPTYDQNIRAVYDSLYIKDSIATQIHRGKTFDDSVAKIDSSNIERLDWLIREFGFPSENLVGIHGWFSHKPVLQLMRHHSSRRQIGLVKDYVGFINTAAKQGLISAYRVPKYITSISSHDQFGETGTITKWMLEDSIRSTPDGRVYSDSIYTYSINGGKVKLDGERAQIGLPLFDIKIKLSKFNWENDTEFILGSGSTPKYSIHDAETLRLTKQYSHEIDIDEP